MPPASRQATRTTATIALAIALSALLTACASSSTDGNASGLPKLPDMPSVPAVATVKPTTKDSGVTERVGQAAITPLSDLNVVQEEIPDALGNAAKGPYAAPSAPGCGVILTEILALDDALGADLDDPKVREKPSLLTRGTDLAENAGVSAVRRTVEGFVPFRSWLRKLSGAEKHSKQVSAAITAGGIRRAYLKGRSDAMGCVRPTNLTTAAAVAPSASAPASAASAPVAPPAGAPPSP